MTDRRKLVLLTALALDLLLGEPPNRWHPVAWMGSAISGAVHRLPRHGRLTPFLSGVALTVAGTAGAALAGRAYAGVTRNLPAAIALLAEAFALKTTFSLRALLSAAAEVDEALWRDDLEEARRLVAWHLVSRDTSALDAAGVASATIESLAENLGDGFLAPLCYFAVAGLPAALAYRCANTADAMLGYHDEEREWLGKAPARLDDVANLLPARLGAACLVAAAALTGDDAANALRVWRRSHSTTASPNAGHPMSAAAGALRVALEKPGHYRLGDGLRDPCREDISRAARLIRAAVAVFVLLLLALPSRREAGLR